MIETSPTQHMTTDGVIVDCGDRIQYEGFYRVCPRHGKLERLNAEYVVKEPEIKKSNRLHTRGHSQGRHVGDFEKGI